MVRDAFFDKPYEPSATGSGAASWEVAPKAAVARGSISANIKHKRKLPALFKAPQPEAEPSAQ